MVLTCVKTLSSLVDGVTPRDEIVPERMRLNLFTSYLFLNFVRLEF
jgi:hypothetical protein